MYANCRHLFATGRRCTQPAVGGTLYCRHHQVVKARLGQIVHDPHGVDKRPLPLVFSEDRAAIQLNLSIVIRAFNARQITVQEANCYGRLLRACEINLRKGPLHGPDRENKPEPRPTRRNPNEAWLTDDDDSEPQLNPNHDPNDDMVRSVILTPEGEEIAPPREVWEEGEVESHSETCPCSKCAEEFRGAEPERHHAKCRCERCRTNPPPTLAENGTVSPESPEAPAAAPSQAEHDEGPAPERWPALSEEEEEERRRKLADKARAIFKSLGFTHQEPSSESTEEPSGASTDDQEQPAQFPRTILQQEPPCNTPSSAPPCPSSSSPSLPTNPSSPRPASSPGWAPPSR